jgi:hypothetical protein
VTGQHHRRMPLIQLLVRLGWQRDPDSWTVPCRDVDGRRARLLIRLAPAGITITPTTPGPLRLTPLQVGRLRGAARDAIQTGSLLTTRSAQRSWRTEGSRRTEAPTTPQAGGRVEHRRPSPELDSRAVRPTRGSPAVEFGNRSAAPEPEKVVDHGLRRDAGRGSG